MQYYKVTYGSGGVDWAKKMNWGTGSWTAANSQSLLSADKSTIFSFAVYNTNSLYFFYFTSFDYTNGAVIGTRYKSGIFWENVFGIVELEEYLVVTALWGSSQEFILYNTLTYQFTMK